MVEASEFPHLANKYHVYGVPRTVVNEVIHLEGAYPEEMMLTELMQVLDDKAMSRLQSEWPGIGSVNYPINLGKLISPRNDFYFTRISRIPLASYLVRPYSMIDEIALLRRARQFDEQALAEIYDTLSPAIYAYAMRYIG